MNALTAVFGLVVTALAFRNARLTGAIAAGAALPPRAGPGSALIAAGLPVIDGRQTRRKDSA